ncbi:MAG: dTDP-4-dehydrorhamnose reductase [Spirochaetes bacterium]|nr:dTDP-4-dehydrorhamnose reductase [Spirochaetota bacterium]
MIWLVGNRGQLGADMEKLLRDGNVAFIASDLEVDITDGRAVERFSSHKKIKWIINCAAYTAVDRAETEREKAFSINSTGAYNLAAAAKKTGAGIVYISTDYVFDGDREGEYTEEDAPNPVSVYGKSKLEGETHTRDTTDKHYIIRTAWLYGGKRGNFVSTMLSLFKKGGEVRVVSDQYGSPTWTKDLAAAVLRIVESGAGGFGVYHYSSEGRTSWYGFAREIHEQGTVLGMLDKKSAVVPITTADYPTAAKRPHNSCLSKERIRKTFGVEIPRWQDSLKNYLLGRGGG